VYFLLRALELAAPGGRVAFVTGAEWLEASYGAPLRRFLVERGFLRAVLVAAPEADVFAGVLSTAAVLLLETSFAPGAVAHAVGLSVDALVAVTAAGGEGAPRVALGDGRWTAAASTVVDGPRLGDRFRVRRGVATGANDFFVLDAARARELGIPARHLVPCVAGPRDLSPRLLLRVAPGRPGRAVERYLAEGEAMGLPARYLCRTRDPWYRVEEVAPAPLLLGYMARSGIRVVDNRAGAVHLNLLHGIYPRPGTPRRLVAELRRYLESPAGQEAARASARRYAGGLMKLEPRDVERICVPAALG
jgi:adenine-specific DNA-methyltransferase